MNNKKKSSEFLFDDLADDGEDNSQDKEQQEREDELNQNAFEQNKQKQNKTLLEITQKHKQKREQSSIISPLVFSKHDSRDPKVSTDESKK